MSEGAHVITLDILSTPVSIILDRLLFTGIWADTFEDLKVEDKIFDALHKKLIILTITANSK